MIDWSSCPAVERDPNRVGGAWVFRGTRVRVAALFENLEDGAQVADFVAWFPGVTLDQVRAVLDHVAHSASARVPPATMLASEPVLRRDWDRPEEDAAWSDL